MQPHFSVKTTEAARTLQIHKMFATRVEGWKKCINFRILSKKVCNEEFKIVKNHRA